MASAHCRASCLLTEVPHHSAMASAETEQDDDKKGKKKKAKPGSFQGLGLRQETYKAIMRMGYKLPTPIQRKTIPIIIEGQDVVAMARTGSGKTAAFLIPVIERLRSHSVAVGVRAVVLSPTRELAMQSAKFFRQLAKYSGLRCCLLVGGQAMETQFAHLANNPDVIIATPGRLVHHMLEADLSLSRVEILVLDEADRLFELGFAEQLQKVLDATPVARQCLLFSATLPSQLLSFSRAGLRNPVFVRLDVEVTLSESLDLWFLYCRKEEKLAAAVSVLRRLHQDGKSTIMFVATRHHVEFFGELLQQVGLTVAVVYGAMDQVARQEQVAKFRKKKAGILVTTDVAARGIDIPLLDHVLNYDFPPSAKLFVHRSGRTARAGRSGLAVSLVTLDDLPYTVELALFLGHKLSVADDSVEDSRNLIGAMPPLDHEVENLNGLLAEEGTAIRSLHKSMMASYHLYHKTRPAASKQSVTRAKQMLEDCGGPTRLQGLLHPAFRDDLSKVGGEAAVAAAKVVGKEGQERIMPGTSGADLAFIQELRGFRPKVSKLGNVISTESTRRMELNKLDANAMRAARTGVNAEDVESGDEEEEGGGDDPSTKRGVKRKQPRDEAPEPARRSSDHPRVSKRRKKQLAKGGDGGKDGLAGDAFDEFDVQVDGVKVGDEAAAAAAADAASGASQDKKSKPQQFYLSVERDNTVDAKERGLDMDQYQMDLLPDEGGDIRKAKSVMRWDSKKKKYLPVMVSVDGRALKTQKKTNESGQRVKGDAQKSKLYEKWARTSKTRIQKVGELEQAFTPLGRFHKAASQDASTVDFGEDGSVERKKKGKGEEAAGAEGKQKKPIVPFHGQVDEKHLTNKQKRLLKRRQAKSAGGDKVLTGKAGRQEVKDAFALQKLKKQKDFNKVRQSPHLRKSRAKMAKDKRMQMHEERQMKFGGRTKSKMLIIEGPKKWKRKGGRVQKGYGTV